MTDHIKLARGTLVQTGGKIISIALGWAIVLTMTNYLGASGFGQYTIITAYLQFFGVMADLGMVLVSAQMLAENPQNRQTVFNNLFTFRLATAFVLLVTAPLFIWLFPYDLAVKTGVVILSLSFFLVALIQVFTGLLQTTLRMTPVVIAELAARLILLGALWYAVANNLGLTIILWGVVGGSVANLLIVWWFARGLVTVRLAFDKQIWRTISARSWPLAVGIFFNLIYLKADTLILSLVRSEAEVGVYGASYRVLEVLITFPTMFAGLLLPLLAGYVVQQKMTEFKNMLQYAFDLMLMLALPMVVGVVALASQIAALFGADFATAGVPLLRYLILATGVIFVGTLFGHVVVALNKQKEVLWIYALTAFVSVLSYVWLVPLYGAPAAALLTLAAESLVAILLYRYLVQQIQWTVSLSKVPKILLALLAMGGWLWLSKNIWLVFIILGAGVIYTGALLMLGVLKPTEIKKILVT